MTTLFSSLGQQVIIGGNGGKYYPFNNLSITPAPVLAANPGRISATFHNPGTVDAYVAPAQVMSGGTLVTLTPSTVALGGCFLVFANGGTLILTGECQGAYQAFSKSASGNPLTVSESNL